MKYNIHLITLLVFCHLNNSLLFAKDNDNDGAKTAAVVLGAAAGGALVGYGLSQLFSTFCSSSDTLVDDAFKELMIAKQNSQQLQILDEEFRGLSSIDKKEAILDQNEELLKDVAVAGQNRMINENNVDGLKRNIKNLKFYQTKLPKRIRKLQRERNQAKYQPIINDMDELVARINSLVPKLDLLNNFVDSHSGYFDLDAKIKTIVNNYNRELKILDSKKILMEELKRIARSSHRTFPYPLIEYVKDLESDISRFDRKITNVRVYPTLKQKALGLKNKLLKLKDIITSDREYFAEMRALEKEKAQQALTSGMFFLGSAAGLAAATCSPKKEKVIVKEVTYVPVEEEVVYEID